MHLASSRRVSGAVCALDGSCSVVPATQRLDQQSKGWQGLEQSSPRIV
jgi:hypothetical protein